MEVGLTGNIGSGKSTASKVFKLLGVPVFYSDDEAKMLYQDKKIMDRVVNLFDESIRQKDGSLNRKALAALAFADKSKLSKLNDIIHPGVGERYQHWLQQHRSAPYTIREAAILIETGAHEKMDCVVLVTAPLEERLQRVLKRDSANIRLIKQRMQHQMPEVEKRKFADMVIENHDSCLMIPQILKIHQQLLAMIKK